MNSNYNDIIDIILTLIEDDSILENIVIGGSVVPFVIKKQVPNHDLKGFYILVKEEKCDLVRSRIKKLSKEYLFDIVADSESLIDYDYGFKIKYENTSVGFFPYIIHDNGIEIKTFSVDRKNNKIKLKQKFIPNLEDKLIIRSAILEDGKKTLVVSPEFIFVEQELNEKILNNELNMDLKKMCDEEVVDYLKDILSKAEIIVESRSIEKRHNYYYLILMVLFIIILYLLYLVFK